MVKFYFIFQKGRKSRDIVYLTPVRIVVLRGVAVVVI